MLVKMKVGLSGSLNGVPYPPAGTEWDVADEARPRSCARRGWRPRSRRPRTKVETAVTPDAEVRRAPADPARRREETI